MTPWEIGSETLWTAGIDAYLLLILGGGFWFNARRERASGRRRPSRPWDGYDAAALLLGAAALAVRFWTLEKFPIQPDEAANLEPDFWGAWFTYNDPRPPLPRLLIHLTTRYPEADTLLGIRAPAALLGGVSVVLCYFGARLRASGPAALIAAGLVSMSSLHLMYSQQQTAYTLWLTLLMAAYITGSKALAGDARQWKWFSLWGALACLSHYFCFPYLAGLGAFTALKRPKAARRFLEAAAPAVLALIPLGLSILVKAGDTGYGEGSLRAALGLPVQEGYWMPLAAIGLCLAFAGRKGRREGDEGSLWMAAAGAGVTLVFGVFAAVSLRYLFPVAPLVFIHAAGRLDPVLPNRRALCAGLLLFAGWCVVEKGVGYLRSEVWANPVEARWLIDEQARRAGGLSPYVLIDPGYRMDTILFELEGRRDAWDTGCEEGDAVKTVRTAGPRLIGVTPDIGPGELTRGLGRMGGFDLLVFEGGNKRPPGWEAPWVAAHCRKLVDVPGSASSYRCGGDPRTISDICTLWRLPEDGVRH